MGSRRVTGASLSGISTLVTLPLWFFVYAAFTNLAISLHRDACERYENARRRQDRSANCTRDF